MTRSSRTALLAGLSALSLSFIPSVSARQNAVLNRVLPDPSLYFLSPPETVLSGSTPLVVVCESSLEPSTITLVVHQRGVPHPASYQPESLIISIDNPALFIYTFRIDGATYPAGAPLSASCSCTFQFAAPLDADPIPLLNVTVTP